MSSKPKQLENDLETKCVLYAQDKGWISSKFTLRGWPDRCFVGPDQRTWYVEFKRLGEHPRPQQLAIHRRFQELGHAVAVIRDLESFRTQLDQFDQAD